MDGYKEIFPLLDMVSSSTATALTHMIDSYELAKKCETLKTLDEFEHIQQVLDCDGETVCLFKTYGDNDINGKIEAAVYILDQHHSGLFGVPPTVFIRTADSVGCLITFVQSDGNISNLTPSNFSSSNYEELQKLCILDIRFGNKDRNPNNILTRKDEDGIHRLIPIDHAECFAGNNKYTLNQMEWAVNQEIDLPFSPKMIEYVANLNACDDIDYLKTCGWSDISPTRFTVPFKIYTCFLQEAVRNGLTPMEIEILARREYTGDQKFNLQNMINDSEHNCGDESLVASAKEKIRDRLKEYARKKPKAKATKKKK
ncbi:unnamed protein product [Cochlearia groenlandica]